MKKIAILTSGGDASTMNKCLSTFVSYAHYNECEIYFIFNGYKGLYLNQFVKANFTETRLWYDLKGTMIFSSRFKGILDDRVSDQMVANLKNAMVDYLVIIGGDGSYKGALLLSKKGAKVYCLPGTIDNDVSSSTYTIGFDTALNVVVNQIREIKSCMNSHGTIGFVEVMGRHCIDLTVFGGIATEADFIITPNHHITPSELLTKIKARRNLNKRGIMILYVENYLGFDGIESPKEYIDYIHQHSSEKVKHNILGYSQRGGNPTAMDLFRSSLMVQKVYQLINDGKYNRIVGNKDLEIVDYGLEEGIAMKNPDRLDLIKMFFRD